MKCTSFVNVLSPVHFWSTKHVSAIFTLNYTTAVKGISSKLSNFPFLLPPCVQALSEQKNVFVIIFSLFSCVRTSVIVKKIIKSTFILVKRAWIQHWKKVAKKVKTLNLGSNFPSSSKSSQIQFFLQPRPKMIDREIDHHMVNHHGQSFGLMN